MTIRDELVKHIKMLEGADWHPVNGLPWFIHTHGPALVEALDLLEQLDCCTGQHCGCRGRTNREVAEHIKEDATSIVKDAARYRWGVEHARWIRHEHEAYVAIPVALGSNLSCAALRTKAIDAARGES